MFKKIILIPGTLVSGIVVANISDRIHQAIDTIDSTTKKGVEAIGGKAGETYAGHKYEQVKKNVKQKVRTIKDLFGYSEETKDKAKEKTTEIASVIKDKGAAILAFLQQFGVVSKDVTIEQFGDLDVEQVIIKATAAPGASHIVTGLKSYIEQAPHAVSQLAETLKDIQEKTNAQQENYNLTDAQRQVLSEFAELLEATRTAFCEHSQQNQ